MSSIAYGLRAEYLDDGPSPFVGGVIRTSSTSDLDVRKALDAGDGIIVVDETANETVNALDAYAPLKRVPAPEGPSAEVLSAFAGRSVADLRADLEARGLPTTGRRAVLVARLAESDAAAAGTDAPPELTSDEASALVEDEQPENPDGAAPEGSDNQTDGNPAGGTTTSTER